MSGLKGAVALGLSAVGGVTCFSETVDDLLMWGHYADGHRGFCLEFDTADPLLGSVKQVRYSDQFPKLDVTAITSKKFDQIMHLLLTKASHWSYEREWRAFHVKPACLFGYSRSSLTGLYFGAKMPEAQQQMIAKLLEKMPTRLYRMRLGASEFRLSSEPVNFTSTDYRKST
jgi:hypothetical protein